MLLLCSQLIDVIKNVKEYENYSFVELDGWGSEEEKVGYAYVDEIIGGPECLSKQVLERYFDYEAFGRDLLLSGEGHVSDGILVLK